MHRGLSESADALCPAAPREPAEGRPLSGSDQSLQRKFVSHRTLVNDSCEGSPNDADAGIEAAAGPPYATLDAEYCNSLSASRGRRCPASSGSPGKPTPLLKEDTLLLPEPIERGAQSSKVFHRTLEHRHFESFGLFDFRNGQTPAQKYLNVPLSLTRSLAESPITEQARAPDAYASEACRDEEPCRRASGSSPQFENRCLSATCPRVPATNNSPP
jgi:hypothetical protein